jgi:hypothetical protein
MLDELADVPGVRGVMMTFDDFVIGMEQFGTRILPLMRCRQTISTSKALAEARLNPPPAAGRLGREPRAGRVREFPPGAALRRSASCRSPARSDLLPENGRW